MHCRARHGSSVCPLNFASLKKMKKPTHPQLSECHLSCAQLHRASFLLRRAVHVLQHVQEALRAVLLCSILPVGQVCAHQPVIIQCFWASVYWCQSCVHKWCHSNKLSEDNLKLKTTRRHSHLPACPPSLHWSVVRSAWPLIP